MKDKRLKFLEKYQASFLTAYFKENIVVPKGLSASYIFYRVARPILKLNYKAFKYFHPNSPWLSQLAILFMEKHLHKRMIGLEYGSGFSTTFLAEKSQEIVAIEHHKEWYNKIDQLIKEKKIENIEYVFIPKEEGPIAEAQKVSFPELASDFKVKNEFADYFNYVKKYPDEHFDYIIIDGRARVECTINSLPKLKKNGLLILDNSERERYAPIFEMLKNWEQSNTSTGLTDTTFFVKPQ